MRHVATKQPSSPPPWYNFHGDKIKVVKGRNPITGQADLLLMSGVIAKIQINRVQQRPWYTLNWFVQHSGGLDCPYTGGRIELSALELAQAFELDDTMNDLWIIQQYGGSVAMQGRFIRWGDYLNIPGPGTGCDGDANISVFISEEIREAVRNMLVAHATISV